MFRRISCVIFFALCSLCSGGAATFGELNAAFEIPFLNDDDLWDDDVSVVATRLGWPEESKSSVDSSYRKYPRADESVLGVRPYSLALYGENCSVSRLSLMFANKGDAINAETTSAGDAMSVRELKNQSKSYKVAIKQDAAPISTCLLLSSPFRLDEQERRTVVNDSICMLNERRVWL